MNLVSIIGRTTKEIECKYTSSEMAVARFTVAVNEGYGEKQKTNFIPVIAFGKTAENCEKFLTKGKQCAIQGRLQSGSYEKDGKKVFTLDVIADRVEFLSAGEKVEKEEQTSIPKGFTEVDDDCPF